MSHRTKRLYAIIIITVFSFIMVTGLGNFRAKQLAVSLTGDQVTQALAVTAQSIDPEKVKDIINNWDEHNPNYTELRKILVSNRQESGLDNIYILYKSKDKDPTKVKWFYVADARAERDPAHIQPGTVENRASAAVENTLKGKVIHDEYHVTDLGTYVSSYQELKDRNGETLAVLAGDFNAGKLTDFLYLTGYVQMGIFIVALFLIGMIVFLSRKQKGEETGKK
jgi:hypothetical protein